MGGYGCGGGDGGDEVVGHYRYHYHDHGLRHYGDDDDDDGSVILLGEM